MGGWVGGVVSWWAGALVGWWAGGLVGGRVGGWGGGLVGGWVGGWWWWCGCGNCHALYVNNIFFRWLGAADIWKT